MVAFSSPGPLLPRRTESVRGENNNRHVQSNPVNKDIEEAMESVCINEVSVLSRLNLEKLSQSKLFVIMRCPY